MIRMRVQHLPQVPCNGFIVEVTDIYDAIKIMDILADYDTFQFENNIKPDYSNMSFLEVFNADEKEWEDWFDEETGISDPKEYVEFLKKEKDRLDLLKELEWKEEVIDSRKNNLKRRIENETKEQRK